MSNTILQINFKFDMSKEEYLEMTRSAAEPIAQFRGCLWKIWLLNEAEQEAGGIYLFENARAVQEYLDSPIVGRMASHPRLSRFSLKTFASINELTETIDRRIQEEIGAFAREQGLDLVLTSGVGFAHPRLDITDAIMTRVNAHAQELRQP